MRLLATALATLLLAAPARAAHLPATFGAPVPTDGVAASTDVASADFNGDRRPDFATANLVTPGTVTVQLSGAQPPTATYPAGGDPLSVTAADLNHDGHPDLVTANFTSVSVLLGKADGTFAAAKVTEVHAPEHALDAAVGQLTADSHPDVLVATSTSDVMLFPGDGAGGLAPPVYIPVDGGTKRIALADVSGDGRTDAVVANAATGAKVLLASDAGLVQEAPTYGTGANSIALADLNADDHPDLLMGRDGHLTVHPGQTGGTFGAERDYETTADAGDLQVGDLNDDARPDVVLTRSAGGLEVLAGKGDGTLDPSTSLPGGLTAGVAIADVDGDGRDDLATAGTDPGFAVRLNTIARSTATAPASSDRRAISITAATTGAQQPAIRLYVKPPGATSFTRAAEQPQGPFTYTATADGAYAFYTALVDADGNEEVAPAAPDATTAVALRREITATPAAFAAQLLGTASAPAETRLTNTGEATLAPRPQLSGSDFALAADECTGATLTPGDSCRLSIVFAPTAAGTRTARIAYDGGALELSGTGIAPPVVLPAPSPQPQPAAKPKVTGKLVATYKKGKLTRLVVRGVTAGATVKAKRGHTTYTKRNASGTVSLARLLKAKGRKVVVTITRAGMTSATQTLTIKRA